MSAPRRTRPLSPRGHSRRLFLRRAAEGGSGLLAVLISADVAGSCDVPITGAPWPSPDGWEHRTIMHFLNTIMPGDDGRPLFPGDRHPLDSAGDATAGAWSACALDVFYDPYYGIAGQGSRRLATALDWATRRAGHGRSFYRADQEERLDVVDALVGGFAGRDVRRAVALAMAATLGAGENRLVTDLLGWPGPNGGYYDGGRHPLAAWQQPVRMTRDGNLP